jgi:hypothetical protein
LFYFQKENLMCVGRKRFRASLVLVASLFLSSSTLAQVRTEPTHDWSGLKTLSSGSKLVIKLKNGKSVEGNLSGVSDTALSLSVSSKPMDFSREDVLSVYQVSAKSAKKATLTGLGVGAAAGAGIGAAGGDSGDHPVFVSKAQLAAGLSILGAGAGALAGYFIGRSGRKRVLIYEAKQP